MKLIPPYIIQTKKNRSEVKVFDLFKKIDGDSDSCLIHSVNLPEHKYKEWAEIDFLFISKSGILVIEVKGGRVSRDGGVWKFKDRYGNINEKNEGPDVQANTAKYALKKKLKKQFPNINFNNIILGWAVVFPDVDYAAQSLELPDELVCDVDSMKKNLFKVFLTNAYKYWINNKTSKGRKYSRLTPQEIRSIKHYIRPNFDLVQTLRSSIKQSHIDMVKMTNAQYKTLDRCIESKRILCTGGAGTGKTFLAVETIKRYTNSKTIFLCKSKILSIFLKNQIDNDLVEVLSLDDLMNLNIKPNIYDVLVVDEGQDLLSMKVLEVLDCLLVNGLEKGRWRWFMDMNNQSGVDGICDKEGYEFLISYDPSIIRLNENCRNTKEIIYQTQLNTGADIGIAKIKGHGMHVQYEHVDSDAEAVSKLELALSKWSKEVDSLNDIVILSPVEFKLSIVNSLSNKWKSVIQILDVDNVINQNNKKVLFSSIKDFKGLEKSIVAMVDMGEAIKNNTPESLIYVGMTRSNSVLWIEIDKHFNEYYTRQQLINIKEIGNIT